MNSIDFNQKYVIFVRKDDILLSFNSDNINCNSFVEEWNTKGCWKVFTSIEDVLVFYKENIKIPRYSTNGSWKLSEEEINKIKEIWNTYKDLL